MLLKIIIPNLLLLIIATTQIAEQKQALPKFQAKATVLTTQKGKIDTKIHGLDVDTPEPTFVAAVAQWRDSLIVKLDDIAKENPSVSLLTAQLKDNIFLGNNSFFISQQIILPMLNGIVTDASTKKELEVATFCKSIQEALKKQLTNAIISDHYDKNKGGGKGKKKKSGYIDDTSTFTEVIMTLPSIANITKGILESRDPNDADLPENKAAKETEEQAKKAIYKKKLDEWLASEIANLEFRERNTFVRIMKPSNLNTQAELIIINHLPKEIKTGLLNTIKTNLIKLDEGDAVSLHSALNIANSAITNFHSENITKESNYKDLSLKELEELKFPSNISGWIFAAEIRISRKEAAYLALIVHWRKGVVGALRRDPNWKEDKLIDPSCLDINSTDVVTKIIPESMRHELLSAIKSTLEKKEQEEGGLTYGDAVEPTVAIVLDFEKKYKGINNPFDYKSMDLEKIPNIDFGTGIANWLKICQSGKRK